MAKDVESTLATRVCTKCDTEKPLSDFPFRKEKGYHKHQCRACDAASALSWYREHTEQASLRIRAWNLKKRYGLSLVDYDKMLEEQNGVCALCSRAPKTKKLHVDHDHETGIVRRLLCAYCNQGVGWAESLGIEAVSSYLLSGKL